MISFGRKNKFDIKLMTLDENATNNYYEDLLRLKQDMLTVNFTQRTPFNFDSAPQHGVIQKKVFVYPPLIPYEYCGLADKYGTRYFSYLGMYAEKRKLFLYHVVVDVENAETIYREMKVIYGKPNNTIVTQMIYDSYAMMKNELL